MIKRILASILALSLYACAQTQQPDVKQVNIRETVHILAADGGNGSGVMISPGVMLTARHVADKITEGLDLYVEPQHIKASVIRVSRDHDIALVSVPGIGCPCAKLAKEAPKIDDPISIIGYPLNKTIGAQIKTNGEYQAKTEDKYVTTAPTYFGNSGGGLFFNGKLIGILVEGHQEANHIGRSVALPYLKEFLKTEG